MSVPTTSEGIAGVMVQIAAEDLGNVVAALVIRHDTDEAIGHIDSAIRQLDAARRMLI